MQSVLSPGGLGRPTKSRKGRRTGLREFSLGEWLEGASSLPSASGTPEAAAERPSLGVTESVEKVQGAGSPSATANGEAEASSPWLASIPPSEF